MKFTLPCAINPVSPGAKAKSEGAAAGLGCIHLPVLQTDGLLLPQASEIK